MRHGLRLLQSCDATACFFVLWFWLGAAAPPREPIRGPLRPRRRSFRRLPPLGCPITVVASHPRAALTAAVWWRTSSRKPTAFDCHTTLGRRVAWESRLARTASRRATWFSITPSGRSPTLGFISGMTALSTHPSPVPRSAWRTCDRAIGRDASTERGASIRGTIETRGAESRKLQDLDGHNENHYHYRNWSFRKGSSWSGPVI